METHVLEHVLSAMKPVNHNAKYKLLVTNWLSSEIYYIKMIPKSEDI